MRRPARLGGLPQDMNAKVAASREDRIAVLLLAQAEGRIRRGDWYDPMDHEPSVAGLLQALGPDLKAPEHCLHDVMPAWLAELVPCIDGNTRANEWPRLVFAAYAAWTAAWAGDPRRRVADVVAMSTVSAKAVPFSGRGSTA